MSDPALQLRTLLPRPSTGADNGDTTGSPGEDENGNGGDRALTLPKKRVVVAAACLPCRKSKTKCDAVRPNCRRCLRLGLICEYDAAKTETPGQAIKRKFDDTSRKAELQEDLINILRTRPDGDVRTVVQRLRAGDDVEAILRLVQDGDLLLQCFLDARSHFRYEIPLSSTLPAHVYISANPYLSSLLHQRTAVDVAKPIPAHVPMSDGNIPYDLPYHTASIVHPHLDKITASRWTTVTSSDELVRRLLVIYLQHELPNNNVFHVDYFLDDMAAGREKYCSSLLVNAVLSLATHGLIDDPDRSEFWDAKNLGSRFLAEALRLWELSDKQDVTDVQAAHAIYSVFNLFGDEHKARRFYLKAIAMAKELGLFLPSLKFANARQQSVYAVTAWNLFSWQAMFNFHLKLPPVISDPPSIPLSTPNIPIEKYFGELWLQYPHTNSLRPVNHALTFYHTVRFRLILNRITCRLYGSGKDKGPLSGLEVLGFYNELMDWFGNLPPALSPENVVFPAAIKMHLLFYGTLDVLFKPLAERQDVVKASPIGSLGPPSPINVLMMTRACIESLVRLYYVRHSFTRVDLLMGQWFMLIGFNALVDLATVKDEDRRKAALSSALLSAKAMREQSRCYWVAEAIFMTLRDHIQPAAPHLFDGHIDRVEYEEERKELVARHIRQSSPQDAAATVAEAADKKRLENLVLFR